MKLQEELVLKGKIFRLLIPAVLKYKTHQVVSFFFGWILFKQKQGSEILFKNALLSSNNFTSKHHLYKCIRQEENEEGLKEEKEWTGTAFSTKVRSISIMQW